jgi:hypothetical protein
MPMPPFTAEDHDVLDRAARWQPQINLSDLNVERLREITARDGVELATAALYDRLRRSNCHGRFIARIEEQEDLRPSIPSENSLLGVVPGAFWREHHHTGADGRFIFPVASEVGLEARLVPVLSFGPLVANAEMLLDWLGRHRDRDVVLVTLSKGGLDLKTAISLSHAQGSLDFHFGHVRAWVSVGGPLQGTPLVDWLRERPLRSAGLRVLLRLRGQRFNVVNELGRPNHAQQWAQSQLPQSIRLIHVLAFPLRRHLTHRWAPRGYNRLAPLGPNDGAGILLGDLTGWPGVVYPVWGADHYLQPRWDINPILRSILVASLDRSCQTRQSAANASPIPVSKSMA